MNALLTTTNRSLFFGVLFLLLSLLLSADDLTVCSYNCGSLSDYYDYLRGAAMQDLMQARYNAEALKMAENEEMQRIAAQMFLSHTEDDKQVAREKWEKDHWASIFTTLTLAPTLEDSPNKRWNKDSSDVLCFYKIRPIVMAPELKRALSSHVKDLTGKSTDTIHELLSEVYTIMARRIFENHLKYDILCLQEADFLTEDLFPARYKAVFSEHPHSKNVIAYDKELFELISSPINIMDRALLLKLKHKPSGKQTIVVSGHFTGCNPYKVEVNPVTGESDSGQGDKELLAVLRELGMSSADLKIVAADTNVTAFHPRLRLLYDAGYRIDAHNFLEPTCCSPYLILNTRIDWIFVKESGKDDPVITNIPVLNVGLNNMQMNISDHKPVAAQISF